MGDSKCCDFISEVSDYIDGELAQDLCADLERHLSECPNCQVVVNTLRKTIDLYYRDGQENVLPDEVRSRLFKRLELRDYKK